MTNAKSVKTNAAIVLGDNFDTISGKKTKKAIYNPPSQIKERKYIETSTRDYSGLVELLTWRRPAYSRTLRKFEKIYLKPIFGNPDIDGNYVKVIGDNPEIAFLAHFDSVHTMGGIQNVEIKDDWIRLAANETQSNCLGADCATGIWLIMQMIEAGINGVYVIHANEESGCIGSKAIVKSEPEWIHNISFAISFDRKDTHSIITHQMNGRTASDAFAESLSGIIGLNQIADDTGSYTDSNEYADIVSECTNLSVGYYNQHSKYESQDLRFAAVLADRLIAADWSQLAIDRKPADYDYAYSYDDYDYSHNYGGYVKPGRQYESRISEYDALYDLICEYPDIAADLLADHGYRAKDLADIIGERLFNTGQGRYKS